jgi:hypothetical protein
LSELEELRDENKREIATLELELVELKKKKKGICG